MESEQWAQDVCDLIGRAGLEEVIILGISFGGFVTQQFLIDFPGVARGGVVVGSSPRRALVEEVVQRYREVGGEEAAVVMRRAMTKPSPAADKEWARVCAPRSRMRPLDEELAQIQDSRHNTPHVNAHFVERFGDLDLRDSLGRAMDPMLVLCGEQDPLTPPALASEIKACATNSDVRVQVMKGSSHQVLWDQPHRTDELLREFATSISHDSVR